MAADFTFSIFFEEEVRIGRRVVDLNAYLLAATIQVFFCAELSLFLVIQSWRGPKLSTQGSEGLPGGGRRFVEAAGGAAGLRQAIGLADGWFDQMRRQAESAGWELQKERSDAL